MLLSIISSSGSTTTPLHGSFEEVKGRIEERKKEKRNQYLEFQIGRRKNEPSIPSSSSFSPSQTKTSSWFSSLSQKNSSSFFFLTELWGKEKERKKIIETKRKKERKEKKRKEKKRKEKKRKEKKKKEIRKRKMIKEKGRHKKTLVFAMTLSSCSWSFLDSLGAFPLKRRS